jgi:hypothetical protein
MKLLLVMMVLLCIAICINAAWSLWNLFANADHQGDRGTTEGFEASRRGRTLALLCRAYAALRPNGAPNRHAARR